MYFIDAVILFNIVRIAEPIWAKHVNSMMAKLSNLHNASILFNLVNITYSYRYPILHINNSQMDSMQAILMIELRADCNDFLMIVVR